MAVRPGSMIVRGEALEARRRRTGLRGQGREALEARPGSTSMRGQGRQAGDHPAAHGSAFDGGVCQAEGIGHGGGLVPSRIGVARPT